MEVFAASTGQEALGLIKREALDIGLFDIKLLTQMVSSY